MSVLPLSVIGGAFSAVSTGVGSLFAPLLKGPLKLRRYHMSMDFALGVMLSAVAFSLVGPELIKGQNFSLVLSGLISGSLFIILTHKLIAYFSRHSEKQSTSILLVSALIFHNLPEGMGAGASLAGMSFQEVLPLQVALSIQNIVEGLLLTLLLHGLGMSLKMAVVGGIFSGMIEMSGAVIAGLFMQKTTLILPFFLSLAGGAMMMSVLIEIYENLGLGKRLQPAQFVTGLMVIPLTNFLLQ